MLKMENKAVSSFIFKFIFFFVCTTFRILASQPGTKLQPLQFTASSSNHWTAREFPTFVFLKQLSGNDFLKSKNLSLQHFKWPFF